MTSSSSSPYIAGYALVFQPLAEVPPDFHSRRTQPLRIVSDDAPAELADPLDARIRGIAETITASFEHASARPTGPYAAIVALPIPGTASVSPSFENVEDVLSDTLAQHVGYPPAEVGSVWGDAPAFRGIRAALTCLSTHDELEACVLLASDACRIEGDTRGAEGAAAAVWLFRAPPQPPCPRLLSVSPPQGRDSATYVRRAVLDALDQARMTPDMLDVVIHEGSRSHRHGVARNLALSGPRGRMWSALRVSPRSLGGEMGVVMPVAQLVYAAQIVKYDSVRCALGLSTPEPAAFIVAPNTRPPALSLLPSVNTSRFFRH